MYEGFVEKCNNFRTKEKNDDEDVISYADMGINTARGKVMFAIGL